MRNDLVRLVNRWEQMEIRNDKDIAEFARITRLLGEELHLRMYFRASEVEDKLRHYKGKWYAFGMDSRVKAKVVAAHLRIGADALKAFGLAGVKMNHSFVKHFVNPERAARGQAKNKPKSTFTIGADA